MIINLIEEQRIVWPIREDTTMLVLWYHEGCTCPTGHPPCSWCMSLTEVEVEIYDTGGQEAVLEFRRMGK